MKRNYLILLLALLLSGSVRQAHAQSNLSAMEQALAECLHRYSTLADTLANSLSAKFRKNSDAQVVIGRSYYANHDFDKARYFIDKARRLNPNSAPASLLEGDIAAYNGDSAKAADLYAQSFKQDPKYEVAYERYVHTVAAHNPQAAVSALNIMARHLPDYPTEAMKASVWFDSGNTAKAAEAYSAADTATMGQGSLLRFAYSLYLTGQYRRAVDIARRGVERFPQSTEFDRPIFFSLAELQQYQEALPYGQKVMAHHTGVPGYERMVRDYVYLSRVYNGLGQYAKAMYPLAECLNDDSLRYTNDARLAKQQATAIVDSLKKSGLYDLAGSTYLAYLTKRNKTTDYDYYLWTEIYHEQLEQAIKAKGDTQAAYAQLDSVYTIFERDHATWDQLYIIYYYHAAYNTSLNDPKAQSGSSLPLYEHMCNLLLANAGIGSEKISMLHDAYSYAMFYAYNSKDMVKGKHYARLLLGVDPGNTTARQVLKIRA